MLWKRHLLCPVTKSFRTYTSSMALPTPSQGDLNNVNAARPHISIKADPEYRYRSLAITESDDDPKIRSTYRPFLLDKQANIGDWIADLELATVTKMAAEDIARTGERLKVLVLYGSLRQRLDSWTVPPFTRLLPRTRSPPRSLLLIPETRSQVVLTLDGLRGFPRPLQAGLRRPGV